MDRYVNIRWSNWNLGNIPVYLAASDTAQVRKCDIIDAIAEHKKKDCNHGSKTHFWR